MLETEPLFCFHHVNAFEAGDDRVIMDCLAMRGGVDFGANFGNLSAEFFQRAPWRTALTRLTLDPKSRRVSFSNNAMEFTPQRAAPHIACRQQGRNNGCFEESYCWISMPPFGRQDWQCKLDF